MLPLLAFCKTVTSSGNVYAFFSLVNQHTHWLWVSLPLLSQPWMSLPTKPRGWALLDGLLGVWGGAVMALVAGGVVVAGVSEVLTGAISVLAFLLLLSLEKTPPIASPPTISAISTTAASAIHGAREAPPWRPGGPPTGPPA